MYRHIEVGFIMESIGTWWMWVGFGVFIVVATLVDIYALRTQGAHKVSVKEALSWSLLWIGQNMMATRKVLRVDKWLCSAATRVGHTESQESRSQNVESYGLSVPPTVPVA